MQCGYNAHSVRVHLCCSSFLVLELNTLLER